MDGLMESTPIAGERARTGKGAGFQHYDTAMRKVRLSMQGLRWTQLLATTTRHYKSGKGLRTGTDDALVAWLHALDASPYVLPQPDAEAAIVAAYADPRRDLEAGALALAELPALRVVRIETIGQLQAWVQRVGPCVVGGLWSPEMDVIARDTEWVGTYCATNLPQTHSVAVVGLRPDAVRIVNNQGAGWGALGRAWMPHDEAQALLARGEAWGVVPVDLTPKRGAK